jgi:hypothetical protein
VGGYATAAGAAEGLRMQATALGSYLFYGRDSMAVATRAGVEEPHRAAPHLALANLG